MCISGIFLCIWGGVIGLDLTDHPGKYIFHCKEWHNVL